MTSKHLTTGSRRLTPVATTCRHIRGSNESSICFHNASHIAFLLEKNTSQRCLCRGHFAKPPENMTINP